MSDSREPSLAAIATTLNIRLKEANMKIEKLKADLAEERARKCLCECGTKRDPNELCEARAILLNTSIEGATDENCDKHTAELVQMLLDRLTDETARKEWWIESRAVLAAGNKAIYFARDGSGLNFRAREPIINGDINAAIDEAMGGGGG